MRGLGGSGARVIGHGSTTPHGLSGLLFPLAGQVFTVHFPFLHCIRRLPGSELPCPARRRRRKAKEKHTKPLILLQLVEDWRLE